MRQWPALVRSTVASLTLPSLGVDAIATPFLSRRGMYFLPRPKQHFPVAAGSIDARVVDDEASVRHFDDGRIFAPADVRMARPRRDDRLRRRLEQPSIAAGRVQDGAGVSRRARLGYGARQHRVSAGTTAPDIRAHQIAFGDRVGTNDPDRID